MSFGPPVRVNDDVPGAGRWSWFGQMDVAPDGRIDVIFNDTRTFQLDQISELYYTFSTDGGVTWAPNEQISPFFNSWDGFPDQDKLGDYYDLISDNVGAHLAWAATFNGEQDVYYVQRRAGRLLPPHRRLRLQRQRHRRHGRPGRRVQP